MLLDFQRLALVGLLVVGWLFYTIVYRILFHPLAKYPGPLAAKITDWHEWQHVTKGDHHLWLWEMHSKYGPVVRVGPNRLSYNTKEAVRSIYGDRKGNIQKAGFTEALALLKGGARNLQTINDRHAYAPRRRLIAHAFSEEALRSSESFIHNSIREWCRIVQAKAPDVKSWTADVDMKVWSTLLTEDILGELCFGESFGACKRGSSDISTIAVEGCKQAQSLCWLFLGDTFYRFLKIIIDYGTKQRWEALKHQINYDETIDAMIDRRKALKNAERKDFFHYLAQAKDHETGGTISPAQMTVEAGVLFGAGFDTSATNISSVLFYLLHYPDILSKVVHEIRSKFNDVEEIVSGPELNSLVYLRGCIEEALRMTPPAPGPLLREVIGEGITIQDEYIPCGTLVSVAPYVIHHNETYFSDSWAFKPERWLGDKSEIDRDAFLAFSHGSRVCIGRSLAYLDMTLSLARILYLFDIRKSPDHATFPDQAKALADAERRHPGKAEYLIEDWFITGRQGPIVQFRARS